MTMSCDECGVSVEQEPLIVCKCRRCEKETDKEEKFVTCTNCIILVDKKHSRVRGYSASFSM